MFSPVTVAPASGPGAILAELRTRMGADLVWFGRLAAVADASAGAGRLWWSGLWTDGLLAPAQALMALDDGPVVNAVGLDLSQPPATWQVQILPPEPTGFWNRAFARDAYLRHDLHEEHRLLVADASGLLGLLAVAWLRRRTGVGARLNRALRDGHGRWAHDRLRQALRESATTAPASGQLVINGRGVQLASPDAQRWLDDARAARLVVAVERAGRALPQPLSAIAVAGAEVRLTPLQGPQGPAWLVQLQPLTAPPLAVRRTLTPAQATVVARVLAGATAAEIAVGLGKSVETVRSQIKQAYARLGVTNRLELARVMAEQPQ